MFKKWKDAGIVHLFDVEIDNLFMNITELTQIV